MTVLYYIAYGSNLHPHRLVQRCPSAFPLGCVPLPDFRLAFQMRSRDGSAKCDLVRSEGDTAWGVLYQVDAIEKPALDRFEGLGQAYVETPLDITFDGIRYKAFAYQGHPERRDPAARPYDWYKALVLAGARYHALPADYVRAIDAVPAVADPDRERREVHEALLREMTAA